jgi:hypothetical protein
MSEPASNKPTPKTVFVVGAGASHEVSMPIASGLKNSIAKALDIKYQFGTKIISGDHRIADALSIAADDINPFLKAGWRICNAMPQAISIDNFIDSHSGDKHIELIGKLAIVRLILEAESKSTLFIEFPSDQKRLNFDRLSETWLHGFTQLLFEGCRCSGLEQRLNSTAFIIFNYDRCVEHYLYHAIQNYYDMTASDVATLLQQLKIYHPYGSVGSLPWRSADNAIEFGATPHPKRLLDLAGQIKTFTEGTDESSSDVDSIRSIMKTSPKLVFLGFAFHRMNIELLLPNSMAKNRAAVQHIFATALNMSRSNTDFIESDLRNRGIGADMQLRRELTCSQLIPEYWHNVSFSR